MNHLAGHSVLILGLGASGLAMARWCLRHGARVQLWDSREHPPMRAVLDQESPGCAWLSGALDPAVLMDVHLVLKSPGLSPMDPAVAPLLRAAHADRVAVAGELALFARALADLKEARGYQPQILAVTGTNGKTTTAQLTGLLVQRCGRRVAVAGNIGPTLLDTLSQALDAEQQAQTLLPEVWVLELSSFQLDGVEGFEPSAAAVLNITQDHLDWHGDMAHYVQAKSRIFGPAPREAEDGTLTLSSTIMVINRDDEQVRALEPAPIAAKAKRGRAGKPLMRRVVRFGLDAPCCPSDFGLVVQGGIAWLVRAHPRDEDEARSARGALDQALHLQRLMPADALRIRGRHNAANALAALALATAIGCPLGVMLHGLREYAGEAHRVSFVLRAADVDVYDDSKGTNVGATVAAIQGLGQDIEPARLVLLLGGDGKGQDFSALRSPVARHARAVALYGRDAHAIADALAGLDLRMQRHEDLVSASSWAFEQAQRGDSVLLSPACASLDQFRDYKHRADVFVDQARAWAQTLGVLA